MDITNELLKRLKSEPGYVSGEALSKALGVSRTSVWKHVGELRKEGYNILSSPNNGYKLAGLPAKLNARELAYGLDTAFMGKDIRCYDIIDSTNSMAKKAAAEGCDEGTVIIADVQTAGRGRRGRSWSSIGGKGIWMSVVLRPEMAIEDIQLITLSASVAVVRAIFNITGIETGIKWPNDIILDGKKVCGILTEMSSEVDRINYLVLGIGLNVNHRPEDFPPEIRDIATSLLAHRLSSGCNENRQPDVDFDRTLLFREILRHLEAVYLTMTVNPDDVIKEWKRWSLTLGRLLKVTIRDVEYSGTAEDITSQGWLVVRCSDGVVRQVMSGEVSVRGIMGYV